MEDPELFIRPDGLPMAFMMSYKGMETRSVKRLVEERGGVVFERPTLSFKKNIVRLVVGSEISLRKDQDMFDHRYVLDCVKEGEILPNLLDYRINSHLPSIFQPYDPIDVLLGYEGWKDIPDVEGEIVSDIEDFIAEEEHVTDTHSKGEVFKPFRNPYSKKHQQEIVNFLVKHSAYKVVKGNSIWQRMAERGVCLGARTWQSMKEHFRKKIVPQIHVYGLSWKQVRRFRAAFGLDEHHESDEEEDGEEETEQRERDKISTCPVDVRNQFKPRRTSSPLETPQDIIEETHEKSNDDADIEERVVPEEEQEEEVSEEEAIAAKRKRKLFSTNVSFLDPDSGSETEFNVTPVKKKKKLRDITEIEDDDEIMEVVSGSELDLNKAIDTSKGDNLDDIDNCINAVNDATYAVSQPLLITSDDIQAGLLENIDVAGRISSKSNQPSQLEISNTPAETLDDIFGEEDDLIQCNSLPAAKRKSASKVSPAIQRPKTNTITSPIKSNTDPMVKSSNLEVLTPQQKRISTSTCRSNSPIQDTRTSPVIHDSISPCRDGSISSMKDGSNSSLKDGSTSPLKDGSTSLLKDGSPAQLKDASASASSLKDRSTSSLKDRSTSPLKDGSLSPSKVRSLSPLKDGSTNSLKNTSPTSLKDRSRSISPLKQTKSVKVQLRKLVLYSPHSLCCRGINSVTGRKVRQMVVAEQESEDDDDPDTAVNDTEVVTEFEENANFTQVKTTEKNISDREFWYKNRHRQPYSRGEEEAIVNYLLRNGGFSVRGGNKVWQKMEEDWICPGRTWHSLRERFEKNIGNNLNKFGVNKKQLLEADMKLSTRGQMGKNQVVRGFRQNANYYTRKEDLKIIKFIVDKKRFDDVGGNEMWQVMEDRKVVDGRSWQSMKERFRKGIKRKLQSYDLSKQTVQAFGESSNSAKKKEKRMA